MLTFTCRKEVFYQNLEILRAVLDKTTADDVDLHPQFLTESLWNRSNKAPVTYVDIYEDRNLSMGIFILKPGMRLPLHNHPQMYGLLKVLAGTVKITSFSLSRDVPEEKPMQSNNINQPLSSIIVERNSDLIVDSASEPILLDPFKGNLHEIESVGGSAAFLDILSPPYETEMQESNCKFGISNQAAGDLNISKWNKVTIVPLASDLKTLKEYLTTTAISIVIRRKRGRGVPVLFSKNVQDHIKLLLEVRPNFLAPTNPYIFAKPQSNKSLSGYKVFGKTCKIVWSKKSCSNYFDQTLATLTQIFNMSESELELPDDVNQTAKITKLLLLMEKGTTAEYKGRCLEEINLNLEEECNKDNNNNNNNNNNTPMIPTEDDNNITLIQSNDNKKRVLTSWTENQKKTVKYIFKYHIVKKIPPKKRECDNLIAQYSK
ncbi:hypothetical protein FQA39_LY06623 [Lamprigera yunnana]|nr:hypothetical protein FQA39_LY06623 [Lamprigera yunnana]